MARAIWSGAVSFGLVNVPVKLFSATEAKDVSFHQFQEGTGQRIRYRRVAEESGEEVGYDDIVKGYEIDKGRHVLVTPEELESVEPGRSHTIEIEDFVDLDQIDPVYFEKTYYLAPAKGAGAEKSYALLRRAMEEANKVAIARFVLRSKQYLAAIRPARGALVLETMFFADEVRDPAHDIDDLPGDDVELSERERRVAGQLIESLSSDWEPERYHDTYRERVLELIGRKAEGDQIVTERPVDDEDKVVDLMAALEASVAAARQGRSKGSAAGSEGGQSEEQDQAAEG
ncbi:MAG: Ku protein [Actinomycetota bacterium]|nr:Ku protein [Actinomycetota bacterium]MDP8955007.1 Ku protein [Actinomycetota bacterium]